MRGGVADEAISFYHTDHLGSSNVITDQNGTQVQYCEYTPYGSTQVNTGTDVTRYKFTGKELDGEGVYFYGARYYDSDIGRFITADPTIQRPYDPQDLNRYSYCRNNPINLVDPSGLGWFSKIWHKVEDFFKEEVLGPIKSAVAAVGSYAILVALTPMTFGWSTAAVIGASAMATHATLDTGEGRQLINRVGNEFFDDVLGMRPDTAKIWGAVVTFMVVNAGYQTALGSMITGGEKVTSKPYKYDPQSKTALDVKVENILNKGEGFNYGGSPWRIEEVSRVLFNKSGELVGVAGKGNVLMLGAQHTGIVMSDIPSMTGRIILKHFPNLSNYYGLWGISHQAVNVSLLEAGYSSTVMSVGGGWTTAVSTVVYGPYGGGVTGAALASQEFSK